MSRSPRASGYFRTSYDQDLALVQTRLERTSLGVFIVVLLAFPLIASPFQLDLACQVFLASIGARYEESEILRGLDAAEEWYVGDGWYTDGAGRNFDGAGANASENNTLRVFTWFAF